MLLLRNYLTITLRNISRHKGYSVINIFGLSIGIACFLLGVLYVQEELSFDAYHEKGDRIYRLVSYAGFAEKRWGNYVSGDPIPDMRETFADVEDAAKTMRCGSDRLKIDVVVFRDIKMLCSETNLFNIFSFNLIEQNLDKTSLFSLTKPIWTVSFECLTDLSAFQSLLAFYLIVLLAYYIGILCPWTNKNTCVLFIHTVGPDSCLNISVLQNGSLTLRQKDL